MMTKKCQKMPRNLFVNIVTLNAVNKVISKFTCQPRNIK